MGNLLSCGGSRPKQETANGCELPKASVGGDVLVDLAQRTSIQSTVAFSGAGSAKVMVKPVAVLLLMARLVSQVCSTKTA
ncbi:MAG: hypothetical protein H8E44_24525 [Planctomycetes bacterium]|nr:hypothetical protein [Planctomycetota bacterium]MBL7043340.1 hypothetical protein [Pirellulaceae bacterium]